MAVHATEGNLVSFVRDIAEAFPCAVLHNEQPGDAGKRVELQQGA